MNSSTDSQHSIWEQKEKTSGQNSRTFSKYIKLECAPGLKKSTRPLVFTSASGCRASETLDGLQCK